MARMIKNCLALILVFGYSISFAGITGKIQGTITDQNGQPLPGSNVMILGTNRGAAADENGFYIILNIAPGNYSLTSQMIGFKSITKTSVIVNSDRPTRVNFSLYTIKFTNGFNLDNRFDAVSAFDKPISSIVYRI